MHGFEKSMLFLLKKHLLFFLLCGIIIRMCIKSSDESNFTIPPLIVQGDRTILLDVHSPLADECRNAIIPFAELEKSPEHLHTYRITPLSLWNAASVNFSGEKVISVLNKYSRYPVPQPVEAWIEQTEGRFGRLVLLPLPENFNRDGLLPDVEYLLLKTEGDIVFKEIYASGSLQKLLIPHDGFSFLLKLVDRGTVKQELMKLGWPVRDDVPLSHGEPLELSLKEKSSGGKPLLIRDYQKNAGDALLGNLEPGTGYGTIVLPCGAGKTIVGMYIMNRLQTCTLIITTNISAVHQWIDELLDKTTLTRDDIAEYTGAEKDIKPVTIATYQILTWRPPQSESFPHFGIFKERSWGLVIYDEVHLLPAPVFRVTAEIQAIRRVGLTATLIREDGCENMIFSLVGPKRYDVPWKELERNGWIASAKCVEICVDLPENKQIEYVTSDLRSKHRISSENPVKIDIVMQLLEKFPNEPCLVIGQFISQLEEVAEKIKAPIITGKTKNLERDKLYADFRSGKIKVLVVSKVANFAIDLPDASMAIQISGTFGSRQEEAQRLGRILRPKERSSLFFTLITRNTVEADFASNRQKFLAEQGYEYYITKYNDEGTLDNFLQRVFYD